MPAPTTADELLDLVHKSGLLEESRLRAHVQKLRETAGVPADPTKLAQLLVRDGLLTFFQAEQLLQGKYKRFSLGKYKVLERLGSGGMGTVFLCEHKLMRRRVAVKVLPIPKAEDDASLKRFYREARAVAAVDHPNIVRAYDIDQDDNLHFIVMEWVDGTNLQDLVKKFGPLDPLRACHYVYGAAVGLQHAHEISLLHRDIKPGNILVDRSGVVKILDLGLARITNDQEDNLTRQNDENVLGTADYLAPEQALDSHTVDIRADIYSLGATFYFLLTGSPPFPEGSVAQKLIWHQSRAPRAIRSIRADVPPELVAVIDRMMAKDPARRYQTPAEVMAALAGWVATPIPPPAEREMPTLSPAVAGPGGRGSGPATMAGPASGAGVFVRTLPGGPSPGPSTMSSAATVIAPAPPLPAATSAGVAPAVWETLDTDTQSVAHDNTGRPGQAGEPDPEERPSRVARRARREERAKVWLLAVGGGVVLALVALVVYFAFFYRFSPLDQPPQSPTPSHRITVSKTPGANTAPSLREALIKAGPGDTIVIAEPKTVEVALKLDRTRHKDITIESATPDGRPAVIEFGGTKGGTMLDATNVEGFRLRKLEFDGKGDAETAVQLGGSSPGIAIDGVTVRGVQKGFDLWNLAGDANRPVTLERVRVVLARLGDIGVLSRVTGELDNRYIVIKSSRFEGPGRGLRLDGQVTELEVSNSRFYNTDVAFSFARLHGRVSKGRITNNTVYNAKIGLQFELPVAKPKDPPDASRYEFRVAHNYFARTPELLKSPVPVPGLADAENGYDPMSTPGSPPLAAELIESPQLPPPNPDDDATFLRFPAGGAPTVGPNKFRLGAQ